MKKLLILLAAGMAVNICAEPLTDALDGFGDALNTLSDAISGKELGGTSGLTSEQQQKLGGILANIFKQEKNPFEAAKLIRINLYNSFDKTYEQLSNEDKAALSKSYEKLYGSIIPLPVAITISNYISLSNDDVQAIQKNRDFFVLVNEMLPSPQQRTILNDYLGKHYYTKFGTWKYADIVKKSLGATVPEDDVMQEAVIPLFSKYENPIIALSQAEATLHNAGLSFDQLSPKNKELFTNLTQSKFNLPGRLNDLLAATRLVTSLTETADREVAIDLLKKNAKGVRILNDLYFAPDGKPTKIGSFIDQLLDSKLRIGIVYWAKNYVTYPFLLGLAELPVPGVVQQAGSTQIGQPEERGGKLPPPLPPRDF